MKYEAGDRVIVDSALAWANVVAAGPGGRYRVRFADGHEVTRGENELSGKPGDKTIAKEIGAKDNKPGGTVPTEVQTTFALLSTKAVSDINIALTLGTDASQAAAYMESALHSVVNAMKAAYTPQERIVAKHLINMVSEVITHRYDVNQPV